ncbi:Hydra magnipapillata [Nesidiocoris tenuis]|nr:Hydra magnipapillata [Nesidiocoris tenuis]
MAFTRPDISCAVSLVAEKLSKPTTSDWSSVKKIFKYVKGTLSYGLLYRRDHNPAILEAFCDADYAGDHLTRRSTTGALCLYAGAAITWISHKQKSVVLSTTEAEFIAASEGAKEVIWANRLLKEMTQLKGKPTMRIDNASALKLVKYPEFHWRTKHIEIRHYFVWEKYQEGALDVEHIEGENQIADILTKPLRKVRFATLRSKLGVIPNDDAEKKLNFWRKY